MTQYALGYVSNGTQKYVLSNCDIVKFSGKCLYANKKSAQRGLDKLMKILPIRVKNLEKYKNTKCQWHDAYVRDLEMLTVGVRVLEIQINVVN